MYCKKCFRISPDGAPYCANCGASMSQPKESVGMLEATKLYFTRYDDIKGRSRRSEYWWATLSIIIISGIVSIVLGSFAAIWSLVTLVPSLTLCVRRLHDIGKSGWWYLVSFIPLVGAIMMIVWFCQDSTADNQWGPNPKC